MPAKAEQERAMTEHRIFSMTFASIYPLYVQKVVRKGRISTELDEVLTWLTGYSPSQLKELTGSDVILRDFFADAPRINPTANKITGVICGYRVEEISDPLMQKIRWMDKLVDELAKGKGIEKILRK